MLNVLALECMRGERSLFSKLSFSIAPQTLLEVRGANGSGKTTLLRTLCGLHAPAAGTISWNGIDIRIAAEEFRARVTYIGHLNAASNDLTAIENLKFAARLAALDASDDQIAAALDWAGLSRNLLQPCATLSQGQRRRVALARLRLASRKSLWILDEPFAALDSAALELARSLLREHLNAGGMAALSTHQNLDIPVQRHETVTLGS